MSSRDQRMLSSAPSGTAEGEAYTYILGAIRRGDYRPGDRLRAEIIASQIGMSRMPVREAFRRLSGEGLLTIRPNRGVTVTVLGKADVDEIFEMRSVLEGLAVRLAAPHVDRAAEQGLRRLLGDMERAVEQRDVQEWLTLHREFHHNLCSLSGRPRLVDAIHRLHTALEPYMRLWFLNTSEPIEAKNEHEAVIEAVVTRDPETAEAVVEAHIVNTAPDLAPYLSAGAKRLHPDQSA